MIIHLEKEATLNDVQQLLKRLKWMGLEALSKKEEDHYEIAIVQGLNENANISLFCSLPKVEKIEGFDKKFKLVGKDFNKKSTFIEIKGRIIGGDALVVMAGPCTIESKEQIEETARLLANAGATILRGGAFKPRTSPYDFQGLGEMGLKYLRDAAEKNGLLTISEVMDAEDIALVAQYVDILQIGARNMQNYSLLKKLGTVSNPILLKRGAAATYQEFLLAAEYIVNAGNPNVILCERGIRTFETYTRNTLDLNAVPVLKKLSHLPVIVDPSHGTGLRELVMPMARAGVAAGADGLMIEVHPEPDKSVSDAQQTITPEAFSHLMEEIKIIASALKKRVV